MTYDNIHNGLRNLSIPVVLGASGIFGFGLGTKKISTLFQQFPNILDEYKDMEKDTLFNRILEVEGYSTKTSQKVVDNISLADKFINQLGKNATFIEKKSTVKDVMKGMKFVFTGFRDKNLEDRVSLLGGKIITNVSKNTSLLVVKDKSAKPSGKMRTAIKLDINILTKQEFIDKYKNEL